MMLPQQWGLQQMAVACLRQAGVRRDFMKLKPSSHPKAFRWFNLQDSTNQNTPYLQYFFCFY